MKLTFYSPARWCLTVVSLFSAPSVQPQTVAPGTLPGTILYSRSGTPNGSMFFLSGDGELEVPIGEGEQPKLSPDRQFIVYHRDRSPYSTANMYVMDLRTGLSSEVADGGSYIVGYDWTTNSARLVFDYSCDIEIIDRNGANRGGFVGGDCYDDCPAVSRVDGSIAFHNIHSGLWLANADGSGKRLIPQTIPNDVWPSWSLDGKWISFMNGPDIYKISPDGSGRTNLTSLKITGDTVNPIGAWTSDGNWIVIGGTVLGTNGLYAIPTDGSRLLLHIPTVAGAPIDWVGSVDTATDLKRIVDLGVWASVNPSPAIAGTPITVSILITNSAQVPATSVQVTNQVSAGAQILSAMSSQGTFSTNGQIVVFSLGDLKAQGFATLTVTELPSGTGRTTNSIYAASSDTELRYANNAAEVVSVVLPVPAVKGMVYALTGSPDGTIWLSAGDGSADQQITTGEHPHLSPDGKYLAFKRNNTSNGFGSLWVRNLQTGDEKLVFGTSDYLVDATWAEDSTHLFFDYGCQIYETDRDGTNSHPVISRDCYDDVPSLFYGTGGIVFHNVHSGLWLASEAGGNIQFVPGTKPGDVWPSWSPDGQFILFTDSVNLFKIRPNGLDLTQLTFLKAPDGFPQGGQFSVDGSIVYSAGSLGGTNGLFAVASDGSGLSQREPSAAGGSVDFVGTVNAPVYGPLSIRISGITIDAVAGTASVSFLSQAGGVYVVEATADLAQPDWKPVRTNTAAGSLLQLINLNTSGAKQQFYRLRQ